MKLNASDILALSHLQALGFERAKGLFFTGVSTDSRTIRPGDLFIALRGDTFDGHNFITKAVEAGAAAIIADSKWLEQNQILFSSLNVPRLIVEDTVRAFGQLANAHRKKFKVPVLVIGGSNGKTTTKEMVSSVLRTKFRILNTEGNLNNHVGVPQTIMRLEKEHQIAILEIGTNHFGEIDYLCSIVEPTHVLITNVGREHLEFFGSLEGVSKAEGEAFEWLNKHRHSTGVGFVNQDDIHLKKQSKKVYKAITYGLAKGPASVKGKVHSINENACVELEVRQRAKKAFRVQLSVPGHHNAYNALAAATVGLTFKVPVKRIQDALSSFSSASKRMQVLKLDSVILLNDTYNSNPDSVMAALGVLGSIGTPGKKIAVLADMLELGENSIGEHARIGEAVTTSGVKHLLTYGPLSMHTHEAAAMTQKSHYEQKAVLSEALFELLSPGDVVLIKGSRGMRMEEVVGFITERFKISKTTPDQAA
jgi:UDP-N-acetylmuramoyl-tripeptide--D-alanyl-D-alanine ligase